MAVGQHEAVAVGPDRVLRVEAQDAVARGVGQRRQGHRRARVPGVGRLDGVHRERADGVDRSQVEIGGVHRQPFRACDGEFVMIGSTCAPVSLRLRGDHRVVPAARAAKRPPPASAPRCPARIRNRRVGLQHRIDDAPRLFDVVLAGEQRGDRRPSHRPAPARRRPSSSAPGCRLASSSHGLRRSPLSLGVHDVQADREFVMSGLIRKRK